jgi:hypothetical protein
MARLLRRIVNQDRLSGYDRALVNYLLDLFRVEDALTETREVTSHVNLVELIIGGYKGVPRILF